ncbi:MAG: hypothetical protein KA314_08770 [Chloroflexi bacterium]|nr:hypothetical protein [Chloroflexota bacterium]MBP8055921.1 hypothetical protein [Chloroflexota bacterium]
MSNQSESPTPSSNSHPETKGLHRHKKHRAHRQQEQNFFVRYRLELAIVGCLIFGLLLLSNPFGLISATAVEANTTTTNFLRWLIFQGGSELIGGILLILGFPLTLLYLRRRVILNQQYWRRNGCPRCGRADLRRTSRTRFDHLLNQVGIPIRRYLCADCHWEGARIDESHV